MIDYEILQDIITDHELCKTQENELAKVVELLKADRLIELPCKVGDTVWAIRYGEETDYIVVPMFILEIHVYEHGVFFVPSENIRAFRLKDFGITVFTTEEKAEEALKRLQGNE